MENKQYQNLREAAWRRPLTRDEQQALQKFLDAHPEAQALWKDEAALNRLLEGLPAARVSSNFTARVLAAAQASPRRRGWHDWLDLSQWLPERTGPRLAMCAMTICIGVLSFHEYEVAHRIKVARELAGVSRVAAMPRIEWLKNFDTINGISHVSVADDELLAALK